MVAACKMTMEGSSQGRHGETRMVCAERYVLHLVLLLLSFLALTWPSPLCLFNRISSWVISSCSLSTLPLKFGTACRLNEVPQATCTLGTLEIEDAVACLSLSPQEVCGSACYCAFNTLKQKIGPILYCVCMHIIAGMCAPPPGSREARS